MSSVISESGSVSRMEKDQTLIRENCTNSTCGDYHGNMQAHTEEYADLEENRIEYDVENTTEAAWMELPEWKKQAEYINFNLFQSGGKYCLQQGGERKCK